MTFQTNFPLSPTKLPYVTVSAKGMSNGLSDIPNDGFDFGPDTLLGTSSKGQYGPPYTQTAGIQEAMNYAATSQLYSATEGYMFYPIRLLAGKYEFSTPITYGIGNHSTSDNIAVSIEGIDAYSLDIVYTGTGNAITIDPNIYNVYLANFIINNPNSTANSLIYWDSNKTYTSLTVKNISNGYGPSSYTMYFNNVAVGFIENVNSPNSIYINGLNGGSILYMQNMMVLTHH